MTDVKKCPFCKKGLMKTIELELKYWMGTRYGNVRESIEALECDQCGWIIFKRKQA